MTHKHTLRTLVRFKGFIVFVAASVQATLLAFAFALTGTAAAQNSFREEVVGIQVGQHHDCASDRNNRS